MSSAQDQQNIAYLQAVHGLAGAMVARLQNGGYWDGELNAAVSQIRQNLCDVFDGLGVEENLHQWLAARDSNRDALRAELTAALEASGANAKAWQDCVEESAIKRTHLMAEIGLTEQQRDAATARAEKAEAAFRGVSEAVSVSGPWACFHCGFMTGDVSEAKAHFGDRDDEEPLCLTWHDLDADGRVSEYQSVIRELDAEREENAAFRTKVEGLEYRVDGQLSEIHSFAPFRKCSGINEVFHVYDSMEGRALVAEAEAASLRAHVERMRRAFKRIMTTDENGNSMNWPEIDEMVRPILAATPAQSLAACKAEALREAKAAINPNVLGNGDYYAGMQAGIESACDTLEEMAQCLEKEAENVQY